jgi:hypothetical protein
MNIEEQDDEFDVEEGTADSAKAWLQENLRVIVSVFIVAAIALGIYSYSGRTEPKADEGMIATVMEDEATSTTDTTEDTVVAPADQKPVQTATVTPDETSKETDAAFIETAVKGQGLTHLARNAAANYLEKNPDSALTAEHKIYIEDYLRKHVAQTHVKAGTSVEFSKTLVQEAITKSKTLTPGQLNNLKQYSARVAAFRK